MKTKEEIVQNWLPRYTDTPLKEDLSPRPSQMGRGLVG
jgi:hypothetical protein